MKFYERLIQIILCSVAVALFTLLIAKLYGTVVKRKMKMKFILLWTSNETVPFSNLGEGQDIFIQNNCSYTNCYVTSNKSLIDLPLFDVVAFSGPYLQEHDILMPNSRSPKQKFAFASTNSSAYNPLCRYHLASYFNWTWTYKLNSDVRWGHLVVRNKSNNVIGPNKVMNWISRIEMEPVSEEFKDRLKKKVRAVSWFSDDCLTDSSREIVVADLQLELKNKYGYEIDTYGKCGKIKCSNHECEQLIDKYYFYLCFENALTEDYVTENLLLALNNNAVPIVYGGANYTMFMPDGMYLNAGTLGVTKLAYTIDKLIRHPKLYEKYFRWKSYYSFHRAADSPDTNEYCKTCEALNNEEKVAETTVYYNFKYWWNNLNHCD